MIQQLFGGMITLMLARFVLNDMPHAAGILGGVPAQEPTEARPKRRSALFRKSGWRRIVEGPERRPSGGDSLFVRLEGEDPYRWFNLSILEVR